MGVNGLWLFAPSYNDKMINKEMTYDEKANTDKLEFYFNEKIKVHIVLRRKLKSGKNEFLNGTLIRNPSHRLWILNENVLGEVRLSISEITPWGVYEFTEAKR